MRILSEIPLVDHTVLLVFHTNLPDIFGSFCLSLDISVYLWMFMFENEPEIRLPVHLRKL